MNEICNESTTLVPLELGFIQRTEPWKLTSNSFPSKAGGRPAWLALGRTPRDLTCQECNKPLCFLLQVYSPIEGKATCFHRSIFLFVCGNGSCYVEGKIPTMRAFRSQLSHENSYYVRDTVDELTIEDIYGHRSNLKTTEGNAKFCAICGCYGELQCDKCMKVSYCCSEHKLSDFNLRHGAECSEMLSGEKQWFPILNCSPNSFIYPEYELVMGPDPHNENSDSEGDDGTDDKSESEEKIRREAEETRLKVEPMAVDTTQHHEGFETEQSSKVENHEKVKKRYHSSIAREPNQVLRYHRGGEPLWISAKHRMEDPPACPRCGAARQFEFQVLPQLLNHLNLEFQGNSIDWGSLYIFTCSASCDIGPRDLEGDAHQDSEYAEEFVWKQDIVD